MGKKKYITSESVTEGHPDKLADLISDAILDEYLRYDKNSHVACEVAVTYDLVVIMGEIKSNAHLNVESIVRKTICEVGYDNNECGFNGNNVEILVKLHQQSTNIDDGVKDDEGAGDQGMMFGYATDETDEFLPAPIYFAHLITKRLSYLRKNEHVDFILPDGKSQVTVEYEGCKVKRVDNIVVSIQHKKNICREELEKFVIKEVIQKVIPEKLLDKNTIYRINPTGKFEIGGPVADTGLTGRKIIVDTYGGVGHHGGGAFSGKDPSKVDRSAAYMMRYIAKNIVASGLIPKVEIGISYAIGEKNPTSLTINTFRKKFSNNLSCEDIKLMICKLFDLSPKGIINFLDLRNPIYMNSTNYGHFGKTILPWEKTDMVIEIKKYLSTNLDLISLE